MNPNPTSVPEGSPSADIDSTSGSPATTSPGQEMPATSDPVPASSSPGSEQPHGPSSFPGAASGGPPAGGLPGSVSNGARWAGRGRRPRRAAVALAALGLTAGVLGGGVGAAAVAGLGDHASAVGHHHPALMSAPVVAPDRGSLGVEAVARAVTPSVVLLQVQGAQGAGEGSGVVLSSNGLILTNDHVVQLAAGEGRIRAVFSDGTSAAARIVGTDPVTDLAVVRAEGTSGLKPASMGTSASLRVGQQVVAIGAPLGLQGTVTTGIVSALDRPVSSTGESGQSTVVDAIQTDAAINPGNSGGPLVDMTGRVVGLDSAIATLGASSGGQSGSIGLGFAIPIDQVMPVVRQIEAGGPVAHAQLGVTVADSADPAGAAIGKVTPGSAAAAAGLTRGDVITRVDHQIIGNADALVAAIRAHTPGTEVTLRYEHDNQQETRSVALGSDQRII
jgi:putative serine protease PepD